MHTPVSASVHDTCLYSYLQRISKKTSSLSWPIHLKFRVRPACRSFFLLYLTYFIHADKHNIHKDIRYLIYQHLYTHDHMLTHTISHLTHAHTQSHHHHTHTKINKITPETHSPSHNTYQITRTHTLLSFRIEIKFE